MKYLLSIIFIITSFISLYKLNNNIELPVKNFEAKIYLNPQFKHLSLGFNKLFSSLLWINTLLDSDYSHYKGGDLRSWMFLRFKTIVELDPYFLEAYHFSSLYLSVIKDDISGADYIFERGLSLFPNDYKLNLHGALHALYENNDLETAQRRLNTIRDKLDKSPFVLATLYSIRARKSDNIEDKRYIIDAISQDKSLNKFIRNKLIEKIKKSINAKEETTKLIAP